MCLPQKQLKQKIALPTSHRCRKEDSKKIPKVLQKSKYEYANGMKNQHQSHCRLVERICKADFLLKTCKQAYEYQLGWSGHVNPVPCWLLQRSSAGGGWRLVTTTASAFTVFDISCCWVVAYRYCHGSLWEAQFPLPHNQKSGVKESTRLVCFCVYEQHHEWEALSR